MKITISSIGYGPVLQYAKQELMRLLKQYSNHQVGTFPDAQREIVLECKNRPAAESDGSYKIVSRVGFGGTVLSIISDYENGVLAGVYDVLERMGLLFQMNGPVCNATLPVYIDHIRQYFVYGEKECTHQPESFDAPPPPDTAYLQ